MSVSRLAIFGDDTRDRWLADVVQPRHLGTALAAGQYTFGDFAPFLRIKLSSASADPAPGTSLSKSSRGSLADHGALEFGKGSHHLRAFAKSRSVGEVFERLEAVGILLRGRWYDSTEDVSLRDNF